VSLPSGFRLNGNLLVNDGPTDTAAGQFGGNDLAAPALWSRQVLSDGRLRAVALVPPADGTGPERFQSVHATAEHVAADLGIGAVEVAVWWAEPPVSRQALRLTSTGWTVAGLAVGADLVVLLTDAALPSVALETALATAWPPGRQESVLVLASGGSGSTPTAAEFAATLSALRLDLACPRGGAA
jgi:glutamate N-acetyltransferase/amino-acid N-acetyltransferase